MIWGLDTVKAALSKMREN